MVILVVNGGKMPTLGKREGVFDVVALALDLGKVYDLVELLGPKFVFAEVTPLVSGVIEHYNGAVTFGHSGVIVLKKGGSCGEFTVVDGVEVAVVGCRRVCLLEAVKSNEFTGLVEAFGVVDVCDLISITLEVVRVVGDREVVEFGNVAGIGISLFDGTLTVGVKGMTVKLTGVKVHFIGFTAGEESFKNLCVAVFVLKIEKNGVIACREGHIVEGDLVAEPDGLLCNVHTADNKAGCLGIEGGVVKGVFKLGGVYVLVVVVLFGVLSENCGAFARCEIEVLGNRKISVAERGQLEVGKSLKRVCGVLTRNPNGFAVELNGVGRGDRGVIFNNYRIFLSRGLAVVAGYEGGAGDDGFEIICEIFGFGFDLGCSRGINDRTA